MGDIMYKGYRIHKGKIATIVMTSEGKWLKPLGSVAACKRYINDELIKKGA